MRKTTTLKAFARVATRQHFQRWYQNICLAPGLSQAPTRGLKLANAFGVSNLNPYRRFNLNPYRRFNLNPYRRFRLRFVKIYVSGITDPNVDLNDLSNFLSTSEGGELTAVVDYGKNVGMLLYLQDPITAEITGIQPPLRSLRPAAFSDDPSQAIAVWNQYETLLNMLVKYPGWQLRATTAMPFSVPTDPVLVMEGARLQPVRRNGPGPNIGIRVSGELLKTLQFKYENNTFTVSTGDLSDVRRVPDAVPMKTDVCCGLPITTRTRVATARVAAAGKIFCQRWQYRQRRAGDSGPR